jgi:hypothetical protein
MRWLSIHTPVGGVGQGQSSVEGDAQLVGILPQYVEEFKGKGVCTETLGLKISCRRDCPGGYDDGHIQNAGSTTPALEGMY